MSFCKTIRLPLFLAFLLSLVSISFALTNVTGCINITVSDTYELANNLVGANQSSPEIGVGQTACIKISTSNVILDCIGFNITGNASGSTIGVVIKGTNNTLRNCQNISNYSTGAYLFQTNRSTIMNVTSIRNSVGFSTSSANNNTITNNTAFNNSITGFFIGASSTFNNVTNNNASFNRGTFAQDGAGFYLTTSAADNRLINNTAHNNTNDGFFADGGDRVLVLNNTAFRNGGRGFRFESSNDNNVTNNTAHGNIGPGFNIQSISGCTVNNNWTGNIAYNNSNAGFSLSCNGNRINNNTAYNNTYGIYILGSSNSNFTNNTVYNNSNSGFYLDSITGPARLINNSAQENTLYDFFVVATSSSHCNIQVIDLLGSGGRFVNYSNSSVSFSNLDLSELFLCNADGSNITNVTIRGSDVLGNNALVLRLTDNATINGSNSSDNYVGFYLLTSTNNSLNNNVAHNDRYAGFLLESSSNNNTLFGNNASNSTIWASFYLVLSSNNNTLSDNIAFGDGGSGFRIASTSNNNTLINNTAYNNSFSNPFVGAVYLQAASFNRFINNSVYNNTNGFQLDLLSDNNVFTGNRVFNNSQTGFYLSNAFSSFNSGNNFSNNTIANNSLNGVHLLNANRTRFVGDHFYNNNPDLFINYSSIALRVVNLSGVIFDSPLGNFTNYTNISLNDSSTSSTNRYSFNWSAEPTSLPTDHSSFAGKFLNITRTSGTNTLDRIVWHWLDSELGASNESAFELWKFSASSVWSSQNTSPDTTGNTFSMTSFTPTSIFAILENTSSPPTPCPVITSPGSYAMNESLVGAPNSVPHLLTTACVVIASSDVVFGCAGYNITGLSGGLGILLNDSVSNVTVENCPRITNYDNGVYVYNSSGNLLRNITSHDNLDTGFTADTSSSNNFTDNAAFGNQNGFYLNAFDPDVSNFNKLTDNTAYDNSVAGFMLDDNSNNNTFINNTAYLNDWGFIAFIGGSNDNNTFVNNTAYNNFQPGFEFDGGSDSNTLLNNTAWNNTFDGFLLFGSNGNTLINNTAHSTRSFGEGFAIQGSFNNMTGNIAYNNTDNGFILFSDSNSLTGNLAYNNSDTGFSVNSQLNNLTNNTAYNNSDNGFYLGDANNTLINNTAHDNGAGGFGDGGFFIECCSADNNLLINNTAHSNTGSGFYQYYSIGTLFANNTAYNNSEHGIFVEGDPATLNNNAAYNNSINGFYLLDSDSANFTGNSAYSNSLSGIYIDDSDDTLITGDHYYDNGQDLLVDGSGIFITLSGVLFDSPIGNLTNYTNISLDDIVASSYSIDHAAQPAPLPAGMLSFAGKFVNITNQSAGVSIDSITWNWLDSELGGFDETGFGLWKHNGTDWLLINGTPDTAANTLAASDLNNFSIFAILQNTAAPPAGDGGEHNPPLSVFPATSCGGNMVTVTNGGLTNGAEVIVTNTANLLEVFRGITNSSGQVGFYACGMEVKIHATKPGYRSQAITAELVSCEQCPIPPPPPPAEQCIPPACCTSDGQCSDTQRCDIPPSSAKGSCKDVTGACGSVANHAFIPYNYECGTELGCPSCPPEAQCIDHRCIRNELFCPEAGIVGSREQCNATENGQPCSLCDYEITAPDGRRYTGKTDKAGTMELPLTLEGIYKIVLLKEGNIVSQLSVKSLPKSKPGEPEKPTLALPDYSLLWLLILLLLLIAAIAYWRSRKKK